MSAPKTFSYQNESKDGEFKRTPSAYRERVTADGSSAYQAESGRYHLYLAHACPWCTRTEIALRLKGLEDVISISYVEPVMGEIDENGTRGWVFNDEYKDPLHGAANVHQLYLKANPEHNSKNTVPILWDKKTNKVVNNESSEILLMLNTEFNQFSQHPAVDYRPQALQAEIDTQNDFMYNRVNNGVYRCGFATSQAAYESAMKDLYEGLDHYEQLLSKQRYVCGETFTEADIRLFVTLVRFDPVYHTHFKCSLRRLRDYPNLINYTRELYQMPELKASTNIELIRRHYYLSHKNINPYSIMALDDTNYDVPHDRERLPSKGCVGHKSS